MSGDRALSSESDWCRVTLACIGDAVITRETEGRITFLNSVAVSLTGWTLQEAVGQPLDSVFRIINQEIRHTVENPAVRALREGVVVGLANHTLLISKNGTEHPVDDSAAPIHNDKGEVAGVVLVFRDVSERRRHEQMVQDALAYAENIIATMREPFVVLDKDLRVVTANRSFHQNFHVSTEETQGRFIYDLGIRVWDRPARCCNIPGGLGWRTATSWRRIARADTIGEADDRSLVGMKSIRECQWKSFPTANTIR
jgi:PAS domain S-box-containing protein